MKIDYKDFGTIEDLEFLYNIEIRDNLILNEETAESLKRTTWPQIVRRVRSQHLRAEYVGCDDNGRLYFRCTSGTTKGKWWHQQIEFVDLKKGIQMLNQNLTVRRKMILKMLINGDLKLACDDLSWHYYFKYVAYKNNYGIATETRAPVRNNRREDHSLCKHLYACLELMPRVSDKILKDYKQKKILPDFGTRLKNKVRRKTTDSEESEQE